VALTNAQRQTALQAIFGSQDVQAINPIPGGTPLATLLPGVTAAQVFTGLIGIIGASYDTSLTTVLTNYVAILNAQLTAAQATVTNLEAEIAAA
jgi:hypothetical protein